MTSAPSWVKALTITTGASCTAKSDGNASRPETSGISTSSVITSGLSRAAWRTASRPFRAVPTISISGDELRRSASSRRINAESSTIKTRIRACPGSRSGWLLRFRVRRHHGGSRRGTRSHLRQIGFEDAAGFSSLASSASTRSRSNGLTMKSIAPSRIESISDCF